MKKELNKSTQLQLDFSSESKSENIESNANSKESKTITAKIISLKEGLNIKESIKEQEIIDFIVSNAKRF